MNHDPYQLDEAATDAVFQALASRERRRMLDLIRAQPGCIISDLLDRFEMSRIGVMKHLKVLEEADLVVSEKAGRERRLYVNTLPLRAIHRRWSDEFDDFWAGSLLDLKRKVETGQ
ncbi:ArsR/SmtB family transcription factor [Niveispirillum sp. KHB5.9]|uniref:ArsR/SmtB family transcription factor n=1 Tax=Niveispirillum sp. KHB5.9 TaxID=3400269 RepID=UPI003A848A89